MGEKVVVSKKVDEAINTFRELGISNFYIASLHLDKSLYIPLGTQKETKVLRDSFKNVDDLYKVLLSDNYEIEASPEEIILEYYEKATKIATSATVSQTSRLTAHARMEAIRFFAKTFDIQIPGIHKKEGEGQ